MLPQIVAGSVLWLPLTIGIYVVASLLYRHAGNAPPLNPTLLTIASISAVLIAFRVPYTAYFESVNILHYLLGTAVVALAVPLYSNLQRLKRDLRPITLAVVCGSLTSIVCGLLIAKALGASPSTLMSLAPKSSTAAVAIEIARGIGGIPAVTACLTICTGITGAVLGPYILTWSGISSPSARGAALGTVSHGIATARAFSESQLTGSCASLAMGLNAILTALLVPLLVAALGMAM
jgi:predicted murein hydrolase (TIGR00659 family)